MNLNTGIYEWFAADLDVATQAEFSKDSDNPIGPLEAFAVLIAYSLWESTIGQQAVLTFVDNDAAKYALAKGTSPCDMMAQIIDAIMQVAISFRALTCYERVPSKSNIADDPS